MLWKLEALHSSGQATTHNSLMVWDRNTGGKFYNIEASLRIGDSWLLEAQGRFFSNQKTSDPAKAFSKDDYIELFLIYIF